MYSVFITDGIKNLERFVDHCNEVGDKIIAMTQNGRVYTVIYEIWGSNN